MLFLLLLFGIEPCSEATSMRFRVVKASAGCWAVGVEADPPGPETGAGVVVVERLGVVATLLKLPAVDGLKFW